MFEVTKENFNGNLDELLMEVFKHCTGREKKDTEYLNPRELYVSPDAMAVMLKHYSQDELRQMIINLYLGRDKCGFLRLWPALMWITLDFGGSSISVSKDFIVDRVPLKKVELTQEQMDRIITKYSRPGGVLIEVFKMLTGKEFGYEELKKKEEGLMMLDFSPSIWEALEHVDKKKYVIDNVHLGWHNPPLNKNLNGYEVMVYKGSIFDNTEIK